MELTDTETDRVLELAETYINGNHSDVGAALAALEPLGAACLALAIYRTLGDQDADRFAAYVARQAEPLAS